MSVRQRFENLQVYEASRSVASLVFPVVRSWPGFERSALGHQLVRAAESIGANIAEATGRETSKEQIRFFVIARGSLLETAHWLSRARDEGLPVPDGIEERLDLCGRLLNGLIRRVRADG